MTKRVLLSNRDINLLSVIAQKTSMSRGDVLGLMRTLSDEAKISPDAYLVLKSLVAESSNPDGASENRRQTSKRTSTAASKKTAQKKSAARKVATDFKRWATSMK